MVFSLETFTFLFPWLYMEVLRDCTKFCAWDLLLVVSGDHAISGIKTGSLTCRACTQSVELSLWLSIYVTFNDIFKVFLLIQFYNTLLEQLPVYLS